jgi:hypothetical protein
MKRLQSLVMERLSPDISSSRIDMTATSIRRWWHASLICALGVSLAATTTSSCFRQVPGQIDQGAVATLHVENRGLTDATVYIVDGTQRIRLGYVSALATTTFPIPRRFVSGRPVRFQADPLGSGPMPVGEEISVFPGDEIVLVIPAR